MCCGRWLVLMIYLGTPADRHQAEYGLRQVTTVVFCGDALAT